MYTRSYFPEEDSISIPKNYDGNAFGGTSDTSDTSDTVGIPTSVAEITKISPRDKVAIEDSFEAEPTEETGALSASVEKEAHAGKGFVLGKFLPEGLKSLLCFDSFHIGTEEILIITLALFLLFSKGGDKECSLILLLLLLIN